MGVRGLQTYIERDCPDACKRVSIQSVANDHRTKFDCVPVLVVDGMSLVNRLYRDSPLEWVYGGQWLQFVEEVEKFITRFRDIGVKLVFFFDGKVSTAKRPEWVRRRLDKSKEIVSVFDMLKLTHTEPDRRYFSLPTSTGNLVSFALKEMGMQVHVTDRDADDMIAEYACQNKEVCAILSQDSDFIIYNTKMYLSLSHLDPETLTTVYYNRNCFASQYLKLNVRQLPIFALLMSNDTLSSDDLRQFHLRISTNGRINMAAMAKNLVKIIKYHNWSGDHTNLRELNDISLNVFGNLNFARQIGEGLASYAVRYHPPGPGSCPDIHPDIVRAAYEKNISCSLAFVYNIIYNHEYESSEVLEEATRFPSSLVYRHVRQRCYGVLFNSFIEAGATASRNPVKIQEWCTYYGNLMQKPELVEPLPLTADLQRASKNPVLSIEDLWLKCTESEKMETFWGIMGLSMDITLLTTLPRHLIALSCILNYLIANTAIGPQLEPLEVSVFIAQALWRKSSENLRSLPAPWVDTNAVSLSSLFMRGVSAVLMALSVCDFPLPVSCVMPWRFFDGKLFHHLYVMAKKDTCPLQTLPE